MTSIGVVHSSLPDQDIKDRTFEGKESVVEIYPKYQEGLSGLEEFSHIFVLSYFNRLREEQIGPLRVKPKRLVRYGYTLDEIPLVGVFALDSPTRPNPIGLSLVSLIRIENGRNLVVSGLDLFEGTPVLDIKPYQSIYRVEKFKVSGWQMEASKRQKGDLSR
ncbi:MAG TPA: tRNA (N6-threonylcarbamoyladenosine(37)-N6)-methyltransferase TrmO [Nitrososphaerales archaeon]|nr:tRNA (N6-threonylcarbamoyladenosine(37)-N6)-methyltransferase TrmO [Nitrososphaerales archaeon]